jgi:hypothetical protein
MEGLCECGDESPGSIKCWEVLEWLHNWRLLEKGSAPWVSEWCPQKMERTWSLYTLHPSKIHVPCYLRDVRFIRLWLWRLSSRIFTIDDDDDDDECLESGESIFGYLGCIMDELLSKLNLRNVKKKRLSYRELLGPKTEFYKNAKWDYNFSLKIKTAHSGWKNLPREQAGSRRPFSLLSLFYRSEDRSITFARNVIKFLPHCTESYPTTI